MKSLDRVKYAIIHLVLDYENVSWFKMREKYNKNVKYLVHNPNCLYGNLNKYMQKLPTLYIPKSLRICISVQKIPLIFMKAALITFFSKIQTGL